MEPGDSSSKQYNSPEKAALTLSCKSMGPAILMDDDRGLAARMTRRSSNNEAENIEAENIEAEFPRRSMEVNLAF